MEDSLYVKAGREEFASPALFQIRAHSRVALPEAPATFAGLQQPKSEKSTGVIALMEMMQKDLASDMADAEADEKMAQTEYEDLMTESAASRAQSAQSIQRVQGRHSNGSYGGVYRELISALKK